MSISLCLIVRNESSNLAACLASARSLADEVVIIDTGSTDDTCDIAIRHRARLFHFPWCDDFAAARNESIRRAFGEWIFWLDADDRVDDGNRRKLERLFAALPKANVAFLLNCVNLSKEGEPVLEAQHVRLFRNDPRIRWKFRVHEQIAPSVLRSGGTLRSTDITVFHTGHGDVEQAKRKLLRNLRLIELDLADRPAHPFLLFYRGSSLLELGRAAEAIVALDFCLANAARGSALARAACTPLATAWLCADGVAEALEHVRRGRAMFPDDIELSFLEAQILAGLGDLASAELELTNLLRRRDAVPTMDATIRSFRARHLLAQVYLAQGRPSDAATEARVVVGVRPSFGQAWLVLCAALLKAGDVGAFDEAMASVESAPGSQLGSLVLTAARRAHLGAREEAAASLMESLRQAPGNEYVAWALRTLLGVAHGNTITPAAIINRLRRTQLL